jgi:pimeloyl-ACP methyl ester carboxylesterase
MERGRTNYLRLLGADQRALFEETEKEAPGFTFVVRSSSAEGDVIEECGHWVFEEKPDFIVDQLNQFWPRHV